MRERRGEQGKLRIGGGGERVGDEIIRKKKVRISDEIK